MIDRFTKPSIVSLVGGKRRGSGRSVCAFRSSYAFSIQYRAWGALKSLTYGNAKTLAMGYGNTLRASSYEVPGVMKKSYQYFDDGKLKFTQDQLTTNSKFDRSYAYDHVGRVTKALSGAEARGGGATDDRPYNEVNTYDAMNHLTSRTIRQWNRDASTGGYAFVNNRSQAFGWMSDADGRLTLSSAGNFEYDTAGQTTTFGDGTPYETDQQFDGDGRRGKTVLRRYDDPTSQWVTEKVTYYVTSSVLGGELVSEVSEQGAKERTFVHANGAVLAIQSVQSGSQYVEWEHYDASGASYRGTGVNGAWAAAAEMEPLGANAGYFKPFTWPESSSIGKIVPYGGIPELLSLSGGCIVDGIRQDCDSALQAAGRGVAAVVTNSSLSINSTLAAQGVSILGKYCVSGSTSLGGAHFENQCFIDRVGFSSGGVLAASVQQKPQNPVPLTGAQVDKLGSNLQKFLDDPECGEFINAMLGSLSNDVWKTSKYGGSLIDAFNRIKSGGGFWSGDTMSRGALAITNPNTLTTTFDSQRSTPLITGQSWQQFGATVILAHEITHVFTNAPNAGVYGHLQMAQAASAAGGGPGLEFPTQQKFGSGDAYDKALSEYYNRRLSYACRKVKL